MLKEWTEPPPMSAAAPAPAVLSSDGTLWVAYRIARDPHHCAVIRFHHVAQYAWGAPPAALGVENPGELPQGSFYEVPPGTSVDADSAWPAVADHLSGRRAGGASCRR